MAFTGFIADAATPPAAGRGQGRPAPSSRAAWARAASRAAEAPRRVASGRVGAAGPACPALTPSASGCGGGGLGRRDGATVAASEV